MSKINNIKKLMQKEKVNASLGGRVVSSFLKRHPEIIKDLENFIERFPCFKKITEVLAWLYTGLEIKKCIVCGTRIDYNKGKRDESLFCSMKCRKSKEGNDVWKEKLKSSIEKKYGEGVINVFQREDVKEKIKRTNLQKYGVEYIGQSEEAKNKMKKTMLERYGVEHNSQIKSFKRNLLNIYYEKLIEKLKDYNLTLITSKDDYKGVNHSQTQADYYEMKCGVCGKEFKYKFNSRKNLKFACPYCHPFYRSRAEEDINNFVSQYFPTITNDRKILMGAKNPELDIYIPSKKIAIEYNGLYWHSQSQGKDKNYHLQKTELCESKGVHLIQIFEDEWEDKQQIVKNRLKNILGVTPYRVFARKCEIREIDNDTTKKFLEKYHIQGSCNSSVRLGLFHKNRLVALMAFGKSRFNKSYDWELLRYVTIGSFNVIGGAGKLLSYFRKHYFGSIISYADRRWSQGSLYKSLGFSELKSSSPAYFYVKDNIRFSRIKFQKHKLKDILEKFDENLSEKENMEMNDYFQVWDCGNKVFVLS